MFEYGTVYIEENENALGELQAAMSPEAAFVAEQLVSEDQAAQDDGAQELSIQPAA